MSRLDRTRVATAAVVVLLAATAGCGDTGDPRPSSSGTSSTPAATSREHGTWLLRFTTASGADGARTGAAYVTFEPITGRTAVRTVPGAIGSDANQDEQVLLVSADHRWAIPDTGVPASQSRSGKLVLYSLSGDTTETLDIRAVTGDPTLEAVAWAFDPTDAGLLRVVDHRRGVWKVDLPARSATKERVLPKRPGWIFGNGFDQTTGEPYVESIDSDETDPPGNGDADVRPLQRQGGTVLQLSGDPVDGLPTPPCGFAGGFRFDDGDAWLFCADTPSISAYRLGEGADAGWVPVGPASARVVPATAVELAFALPPVG
ncbi:MAG TPA: hypothetical protein VFE07_09700 [Marmoricola sp.]|nr:hypothetical protein [Marmoricola sp.]